MAKEQSDRTRLVETRTRERVPIKGDAFAGSVREVVGNPGKLAMDGYCAALWSLDEVEATIHVYKMVGPGGYTKKGELTHQEYLPKEVEPYVMATWGPGRYQLRPNLLGRYYSPTSVVYAVGEEERDVVPGHDVDGAIVDATKRIGNIQALEKLNEITSGKSGGMDMGGIAALMTAMATMMKPDMSVVTASLDAANRRAEAAELRNHELTLKMMDGRQGALAGTGPLLGELFKYLKPEHLQALLSSPETSWLDTIRDLVKDFGPALQTVVVKLFEQSGLANAPGVRALPPAGPADKMSAVGPTPSTPGTEGGTMPIPLNEEQTFAKGLLLDFIKAGDWPNALAALENFPGFVPSEAGPMPMGVAMIQRIDPATNPKIYLSQLMMIMPEIKGMMPQAEAFIVHIQKRILADDEAMARQGSTGPDTVRPTPQGGE